MGRSHQVSPEILQQEKSYKHLLNFFVICLVSLAGNTVIGVIVYKTKSMRKPINFLMVNAETQTQKRSNVQDNNDVTKHSLSSIPSIKVCGHFGNVVKPSAVFALLTLYSFSRLRKKYFRISFLLHFFFIISSL